MKHPIGQTRNGLSIYVDLIGSKAAKSIAQQPHLLGLAKEMFQSVTVRSPEINIERDMGRAIGYSMVVDTKDTDTIIYGRLVRDAVYTRFVKNGKPLTTQYLTATLRRDADNNYELYDIWIGRLQPPRPGSDNETAESKEYWSKHAFVLDNQQLQLQTVTRECPY